MTKGREIKSEWTRADIDEMFDKYIPVTVPVSISITGKQKILGFSEAEKILRKAKKISLENCSCREERKNCEGPLDVCLCMDDEADEAMKERHAWLTTFDKAMDALERAHNAGLVHLAYESKKNGNISIICSCCSCCCHSLAGITRFGYNPEIVASADVIAVRNPSKCNNCGVCVDSCHFFAWGLVGGEVHHYSMKCTGCGICASFCPAGAISMKKRTKGSGGRKRSAASKKPGKRAS